MTDSWASFSSPRVPASPGCRPRRAVRCWLPSMRASQMPAAATRGAGAVFEVGSFSPVLRGLRGHGGQKA